MFYQIKRKPHDESIYLNEFFFWQIYFLEKFHNFLLYDFKAKNQI